MHINGRGCGADGQGGGRGGSERNVGAADVDQNGAHAIVARDHANHGQNWDAGRGGDSGGRNGGKFGRGSYQRY